MSYWYDVSKKFNSRGRKAFLIDVDSDIESLPTTHVAGAVINGDNVTNQPVTAGSIARSIGSGNCFMLNSSDSWVKLQ